MGAILLGSMCCCLGLWVQKSKLIRTKQRFFEHNGGVILQQQMRSYSTAGAATGGFKIFSSEELKKATNNFAADQILGRGGHGIVYRGVLADNSVVAIKKSKMMEEAETKEFAREMLILSQINHRNVVKLYGCCLEVEVPMLVYEFIPNGTLYQLIHGDRHHHGARVSFATRLKIAHETAEALAYLHSWASPPIIHGDVKSPNILIDDDHTVKVADFGASTLAPTDEAQFVTFVQGTCGYLDPEYMQTCKLTEKSDVYSFGVVLLELLTRRKALNLQAADGEEKNLSSRFLLAASARRLDEIVDAQIVNEQSIEPIEQVAELARECLEMNSEKRPSMREVAEELGRLRKLLQQHPWGQKSSEEMQGFLAGGSPTTSTYSEIELSNAYVSLDDSAYLGVQSPR